MKPQIINFVILFVSIFLKLCYWAIFAHVLMSWLARGRTKFGVILDEIVRPILAPFRWVRIGMIDLSPIAALIVVDYAGDFLVKFLTKFL